jgi:hypothetical protein
LWSRPVFPSLPQPPVESQADDADYQIEALHHSDKPFPELESPDSDDEERPPLVKRPSERAVGPGGGVSSPENLLEGVGRLIEENLRLQQSGRKLAEAEARVKRLTKIIIDSGMSGGAPIDDEITQQFSVLRNKIFTYVRRYCGKQSSKRRDYAYLPSSSKDFFVMHVIAEGIYSSFFGLGASLFGFDRDTDNYLGCLESNLISSRKSKWLDFVFR